jgi:hypothetical protein
VEYLPGSKSMLLEDGQSVAAFFELAPVGTEGREMAWLWQARDALENALQDSFDELDENPWVCSSTPRTNRLGQLPARAGDYVRPRAQGSAFTEFYLRFFAHHLRAIAKPGGLFEDTTVTRLPWRGQVRRVRMVVYRRANATTHRGAASPRAGADDDLRPARGRPRQRRREGPAHGGGRHPRLAAALVQPAPDAARPQRRRPGALLRADALPRGSRRRRDRAGERRLRQRLFFGQPRSDVANGTWFDGMPHRVIVMDRLRMPPGTGHVTGETRKGGDAVNALFDQMPEDTVMCLTWSPRRRTCSKRT